MILVIYIGQLDYVVFPSRERRWLLRGVVQAVQARQHLSFHLLRIADQGSANNGDLVVSCATLENLLCQSHEYY